MTPPSSTATARDQDAQLTAHRREDKYLLSADAAKAVAAAANRHLTPHRFRFTAASIIAHEVGIHQASLILGHEDVATTEQYVLRGYVDATADTIHDAFARFHERK